MALKERRAVVCYRCGTLLGELEVELTQEGMARFREQAQAMRRDHDCGVQDTRKETVSAGRR
ncbi:MAG: hypothetical protein FWJ65_06015 [Limnochordales bacterium]